MAANSKVNRIAGLSLAAAVAGTLTLVPVAGAQTTSPSSETATSKAPVVTTEDAATGTTSTTAQQSTTTVTAGQTGEGTPKASTSVTPTTDWAEIFKGLASLIVPATATGSGTSGATFESDGQNYTALASNPTNGRLYAISDKGHLLRIHPQTGNLKDLGEIPGLDAKAITSAAFTKNGTLVLIDGDSVYTKDLSNDPTGPRSVPADQKFVEKAIDTEREIPALAWAPTDNADELVALATTNNGDAVTWTLSVDGDEATVSEADVAVRDTVNLSKVEEFAYAYRDGEATVFADAAGHSVTLEGGKVVAADSGRTVEDNYKAVAGLQPKPTSSAAAVPSSEASTTPAPATTSTSTTVTSASEATTTTPVVSEPSPISQTTTATTTTTASSTNLIEFDVLVKTADDKLVEGAEFRSEDGTVAGTTGANGRGKIYLDPKKDNVSLVRLTLKEAPKGYNNTEVTVRRDEGEVVLVLPRDPKATTSSTLSRPDQVLKAINDIKPVASSLLAPAAAIAGAAGIAGAGARSTKTTFAGTKVTTTSGTATTTSRSTGRSTSVTPSARVVTRNGTTAAVAKANTSTRATASNNDSDERDGDLADTGTPMRAIIALGVLSMLIGGAYLALGRRRENA